MLICMLFICPSGEISMVICIFLSLLSCYAQSEFFTVPPPLRCCSSSIGRVILTLCQRRWPLAINPVLLIKIKTNAFRNLNSLLEFTFLFSSYDIPSMLRTCNLDVIQCTAYKVIRVVLSLTIFFPIKLSIICKCLNQKDKTEMVKTTSIQGCIYRIEMV